MEAGVGESTGGRGFQQKDGDESRRVEAGAEVWRQEEGRRQEGGGGKSRGPATGGGGGVAERRQKSDGCR